GEGGEVYKAETIGKVGFQGLGDGDGESCLADASCAGEGEEARLGQQADELLDGFLPTDEGGDRMGQTVRWRRGGGGSCRREGGSGLLASLFPQAMIESGGLGIGLRVEFVMQEQAEVPISLRDGSIVTLLRQRLHQSALRRLAEGVGGDRPPK